MISIDSLLIDIFFIKIDQLNEVYNKIVDIRNYLIKQ